MCIYYIHQTPVKITIKSPPIETKSSFLGPKNNQTTAEARGHGALHPGAGYAGGTGTGGGRGSFAPEAGLREAVAEGDEGNGSTGGWRTVARKMLGNLGHLMRLFGFSDYQQLEFHMVSINPTVFSC